MNPFIALALKALSPELEPLRAAVTKGDPDAGAVVIQGIRDRHPLVAGTVEKLFTGTPAEVVSRVSEYWPEFGEIPRVQEFVANLQRKLAQEVARPRFRK